MSSIRKKQDARKAKEEKEKGKSQDYCVTFKYENYFKISLSVYTRTLEAFF